MEVAMQVTVRVPVQALPDFNFDSSCSTPYITAPSSPSSAASSATVPFHWEEKPGTPRRNGNRANSTEFFDDDDFEFDFSGQLWRSSVSAADELFYGGKILPLKPPPGYESGVASATPCSPRSPRSPRQKKIELSEFDPFQVAIDETRKRDAKEELKQRGRGPNFNYSPAGGRRGMSRSMSPMRVADAMLDDDGSCGSEFSSSNSKIAGDVTTGKQSYGAAFLSAISFSKGRPQRKWKLRDLLLFRSASEGRATSFRSTEIKYTVLSRKSESSSTVEGAEDGKASSFRSTESFGSSRRLRGGQAAVSAHEMHYTRNRAAAEEMRRKTFLPYKQGLLGCLGFSPGGVPDISSRGVGSLTRG